LTKKTRIESHDDRFDSWLENHPRFLARVKRARKDIREGKGVKLENVAMARNGK
jgi:hypothetical protein